MFRMIVMSVTLFCGLSIIFNWSRRTLLQRLAHSTTDKDYSRRVRCKRLSAALVDKWQKLRSPQATLFAKQVELDYQGNKHLSYGSQQDHDGSSKNRHATRDFTLNLSFAQSSKKE